MRVVGLACLAVFISVPAFAAPAVDNERVTVWDIPLAKGTSAPATPSDFDSVTMFLEGGSVSTKHADGSVTTATRQFGDAVFNKKGSPSVDTAASDGVREIVIALKDPKRSVIDPSPAGIPISFPRPGADKMLEGDGFIVWRFNWIPKTPVAMHHHDKDTVMVFRYNGTLRSTPLTGEARDIPFKQGQISYAKAGGTHTETLMTEHQAAVDLELK